MTNKEQIERISKLLNELSLDDITSTEFDEMFPKQSINDLKDELWRMYCFADDVCDTINMGDTVEQEHCGDAVSRQGVAEVLLKYAHSTEGKAFAEFLVSQINDLPSVTPQPNVERGMIDWITEETPPEADAYLVSWKHPYWEQTAYIGICEWDGTRWLVENMPQAKLYKENIIITAWADPEPYKEG